MSKEPGAKPERFDEPDVIPPAEYAVGVSDDDCPSIVLKRKGKTVATLVVPEAELAALVRAGNLHQSLIDALTAAEEAIDQAADIMFSGSDGQPVTFLKPRDIDDAYRTLVGVMVQVHEALAAA